MLENLEIQLCVHTTQRMYTFSIFTFCLFSFRAHARSMRQMNQMMNSFFSDPFEDLMNDMGMPRLMGSGNNHRPASRDLMPFGFGGFPNMNRLFQNMVSREIAICYVQLIIPSTRVVEIIPDPD